MVDTLPSDLPPRIGTRDSYTIALSFLASVTIHASVLHFGGWPATEVARDAPASLTVTLRAAAAVSAVPTVPAAVAAPAPPEAEEVAKPDAAPRRPAARLQASARPKVPGAPALAATTLPATRSDRPRREEQAEPAVDQAASDQGASGNGARHERTGEADDPLPVAAAAERAPTSVPLESRARYLSAPPPRYPLVARRDGIEGTVTIRVLVTAHGAPSRVEVERSSGFEMLDRAAIEAVKEWRFEPARRGIHPVDAWVLVPVAFHLRSG